MTRQPHITHRSEYLRGRQEGRRDVLADASYRPQDGAVGSQDSKRAYMLGYGDGWDESNPCTNGTCEHLAHR